MLGPAWSETQPPVRQVLLLQSYDRGNMMLDHFTANVRVDLDRIAGSPVNVVQVVVGPTGFVGASEQAMVDFIHLRLRRSSKARAHRVGSPAWRRYSRTNIDGTLPDRTPLLFTAVDQRYLQDAPLGENETAVAVASDFPRFVDEILQLLPQTGRVFMVMGSGQIGRFWHQELNQQFTRFRDRLTFVWSDEMSLPEILRSCANLPAHSAITLFHAFGTDAAGAALTRTSEYSPIFTATANASPVRQGHSAVHGLRESSAAGWMSGLTHLARHTGRLGSSTPERRAARQHQGAAASARSTALRLARAAKVGHTGSSVAVRAAWCAYRNLSVWQEYPRERF